MHVHNITIRIRFEWTISFLWFTLAEYHLRAGTVLHDVTWTPWVCLWSVRVSRKRNTQCWGGIVCCASHCRVSSLDSYELVPSKHCTCDHGLTEVYDTNQSINQSTETYVAPIEYRLIAAVGSGNRWTTSALRLLLQERGWRWGGHWARSL